MGTTPTTGNAISIGRVWSSFDTTADGYTSGKVRPYPPPGSTNISLRGTLGSQRNVATSPPGGSAAAQITTGTASLSNFWNLGTPDTYPP